LFGQSNKALTWHPDITNLLPNTQKSFEFLTRKLPRMYKSICYNITPPSPPKYTNMVVPIVNHATIKIGCVGGHNWAKHWIGLGSLIFHNWAINTFNNVILFSKECLYFMEEKLLWNFHSRNLGWFKEFQSDTSFEPCVFWFQVYEALVFDQSNELKPMLHTFLNFNRFSSSSRVSTWRFQVTLEPSLELN